VNGEEENKWATWHAPNDLDDFTIFSFWYHLFSRLAMHVVDFVWIGVSGSRI